MLGRTHRVPRVRVALSGRRRLIAMMAVTAAALTGGGSLPPVAAQVHGFGDAVREGLDRLVYEDQYPAALASTIGRDGRTHHFTAGVADVMTGATVPVDGQVRAGSNTKTFTATVVLQLVGEGRVTLDAPIEEYLPGLVRGEGIDGRRITVRQLLQHTSGLPNYTDYLDDITGKNRHTYFPPRTLLDMALKHKALFAPGTRWSYSNTNYLLAGMLIEKVTSRPVAEQIAKRVIDRIGLRHTYFPGVGDEGIREAHPQGYFAAKPGAPLEDITTMNPSWAWAAGQVISTPGDLNHLFTALLNGELIRPAQLAQMRTTVPVTGDAGTRYGTRYGLGVTSTPMSCGGLMWGHGGDIPGYGTRTGATDDGRAITIAVTADAPPTQQGPVDVLAVLDNALCG
ncbi:serine hydrolase domain-containing protein [Streptomyces yunnanensis]|uniref:D-alanyl-D-alanine carboxypeptidase n=1 Tax=Streptomyces yunnanensis TaxID=156453 RepID=A0A9X8N631_9ACTN|nr:serine hydrolase domain-containing protein [Streptomyces yunnanensis]SHN12719.1 D-alanyl-D-alanine carboxypeptidase [Streptomyces yunnanensis]